MSRGVSFRGLAEPRPDWFDQIACRGIDPDLFFPERGYGPDLRAAKAVCVGCPVRVECLDWAIANGEWSGVYGGTSGKERIALARSRKRGAA